MCCILLKDKELSATFDLQHLKVNDDMTMFLFKNPFKKQTFICPYCFNEVNSDDILFQCAEVCQAPDPVRTEFEECRPVSADEIRVYKWVFEGEKVNPVLRWFGVKKPHKVPCSRCGIPTSVKVCPECHSMYPYEYAKYPTPTIAIIGAKETGKSHYIAVLIKQIRDLENQFRWSLMALDEDTTPRYKRYFGEPLARKEVLPPTRGAAAAAELRNPLLYSLSFPNSNKFITSTLAFFDTAGEDMDDRSVMTRYTPYIYNAKGIILLLDPLQQETLRSQLPQKRLDELSQTLRENANAAAGEITERLVRVIRENRELPRNKKIDVPLAVVFSKMDEFRDVFGEDAPIYRPSQHRGYFNKAEFDEINKYVSGWVGRVDPEFIGATKQFKDVGFFGVSALGQQPDRIGNNQRLKSPPRPMRVEDPFLWLLWKKGGFIDSK